MRFRKLKDNLFGVIDVGLIIGVGVLFAGLMVVAYIIFTLVDQLAFAPSNALSDNFNASVGNVTAGFDNAVNLLLVAITIFILAIAIAALLMLRGRR